MLQICTLAPLVTAGMLGSLQANATPLLTATHLRLTVGPERGELDVDLLNYLTACEPREEACGKCNLRKGKDKLLDSVYVV
jgi:hypothetical protein